MTEINLETLTSLSKRRGFIYQGSEIYGGLAGTWDYGPLGVSLKRNIVDLWWKSFVDTRTDMLGLDSAILMNHKVWEASGHTDTFFDLLVECMHCHSMFREDHLNKDKPCPVCGEKDMYSDSRKFNLLLKTQVGTSWMGWEANDGTYLDNSEVIVVSEDGQEKDRFYIPSNRKFTGLVSYYKNSASYLRPETAQGIFTNYKNVIDSFYPDIPFGIAQVGKSFRNEISPRDFIFRSREFEQMEIEYFVHPSTWKTDFEKWREDINNFLFNVIKLPKNNVHETEVTAKDRAHYSKRTIDFEFDFPHKRDELLGLAYRTDFDLINHEKASGKSMKYRPKDGSKPYVPHVIEPSFGVERLFMAVLVSAYHEDEQNGDTRVFLKLPSNLAPVKVAVFPLVRNKPGLSEEAKKTYANLKEVFGAVMWDDNGNIGKRYRRQDEIGTPYCVTIDYQTLDDRSVTVRDRDTTEQKRIKITDLVKHLEDSIGKK